MSRMGTMPYGLDMYGSKYTSGLQCGSPLGLPVPSILAVFSLCQIYIWTIACASPECYGHRGVTGRWKKSGPWVTGTEPMSDVVPRVMKGGGAEVRGRALPGPSLTFTYCFQGWLLNLPLSPRPRWAVLCGGGCALTQLSAEAEGGPATN